MNNAGKEQISLASDKADSRSPFAENNTTVLYALIGILSMGIFVADHMAPLGVAVWILQFIPLTLSLITWRPSAPIIVAAGATFLLFVSYFTDNGPQFAEIARTNRSLGLASIWLMAFMGYFFIRSRIEARQEEWVQSGLAGLNEALGGEQRLEELGQSVLRYLAGYTEALAGAIYVERDGRYCRCSTFGVPPGSTPDSISHDDGLLGQAVRDRRPFFLREVPDGYLSYGSALGHSKPVQIAIMPGIADRQVNAILELGYPKTTGEGPLELLRRASEVIGIAVRTAEYRSDLQNLLEETQRQAEELQAQGEELRVSNEELEEQSRTLQESQSRLEQQQAELEQTNAQLEEQTQLLEGQRDELAKAKAELQLHSRELAQSSQYKSDFLANMSHELRTPLNSSLILAKLLADNPEGNLTAEQVRYAETIQSAGNDLLHLINDILDLSKIESGHMDIEAETVSVPALVESFRRSFEPLAKEKGLAFEISIAAEAPETMQTDGKRLEQVVKNLLSNAVKFTGSGSVRLEIAARPENRVAFSVIDTGIGIPGDKRETIFEAFRQADGTTSRKFGGTGLGLSISKELARLLGGEIGLESAPGKGSTFTLTIPQSWTPDLVPARDDKTVQAHGKAAEPAHMQRHSPAAERSSSPGKPVARQRSMDDDRDKLTGDKRVLLVVEDDISFARILQDLAHDMGFQCLIATGAEEGIDTCIEFLPHAVILDINLPDHSGLSVLDRIKHDHRTRHIPVHVISAEDYAKTARALGAIDYLRKPVNRETLENALRRLESHLVRDVRRLLIVEDDRVQRQSLEKLLGSKDVETVGVGTARECLERLRTETFDCMVLDLSLPDQTGYALLQTLSEEEDYSFPPVIVYTGRDLSRDEEQQLSRYSKSIIIKGAKSPERLLDEVTLFLHQVVTELPDEQRNLLKKAMNRDAILEGRRILVVEDDIRNVYSLTSILEPRGAIVEIARNGVEALQTLERTKIDLVLMDVMMPEMDGLTATRTIRQNPKLKNLPIITLTAKAMKDDQQRCLDAGANDYMAKPLDVDKLLSLVRVWMPR